MAAKRKRKPQNRVSEVVRDERGRIIKGTPNPGGRPKEEKEIALMCRELSPMVIEMLGKKARKGSIEAGKVLLDRGFGKAKQVIELSGKDGKPLATMRIDVTTLTTEQLQTLKAIRAAQLAQAAPALPPPAAEPEEREDG